MENSNSRGQGTIDVLILLFILSAVMVAALEFSESNYNCVTGVQLSKEMQ